MATYFKEHNQLEGFFGGYALLRTLRLIKSHSMETPGTNDGVGFVLIYIYTGPIWGWG